ncbi:MAG: quinone-dependent dihydroorotate dehydrogenase [Bacteroidales bacterium]|nr:quinone-dependent dihydroorotate dehydrogenase [Bacteroidales bacterium]
MYRTIIRPLLFIFPPETIHRILVTGIKLAFKLPLVRSLISRFYTVKDPLLKTSFLGMTFDSPVGLAAGFDKNAEVFNEFHAFGFSHIEIGTVTPEGQPGNPKPRSFRIPVDRGLINRMGFNNHGARATVRNLSSVKKRGVILGGNIGKNTLTPNEIAVEDYEKVFRILYDSVDYFVINVSCPNLSDLHELQDREALEAILGRILAVREQMNIRKPVLLKISPDLNKRQLDETLELISMLNLDGMVATNTTIRRDGLKTESGVIDKIGNGGLSGAPLKKRSLEVVRYISVKTEGKLPIIGVGGIMTVQDALDMLDAGAHLIQVYTGFIYEGPGFVKRINRAILTKRRAEINR